MNIKDQWKRALARLAARAAGREIPAEAAGAQRKTLALPSVLMPCAISGRPLPRPTPVNLRRFAETPLVRRAINLIKDRIAAMDWQVRLRRDQDPERVAWAEKRAGILRRSLEFPNPSDSFRVLLEQVIEDALTGGFGAIEMEPTGDPAKPFELWPVDGASIRIDPQWDGRPDSIRYAQATGLAGTGAIIPLEDRQLLYLRMNPRSYTPWGLGPLEVAFETVNAFLSAHRFAGKLASNSVVQYALWLNETTPAQHERLIRWWQDEIEGTGRVPLLSTEQKPEVLRFAAGTRAAALAALPSLLGMAVDYAPGWDGHDARRKCGIITHADVEGPRLTVAGYLFAKDFPEVERQMRQCLSGAMGMSWELADAHVEDLRAEIWTLTRATFTGAATLTIAPVGNVTHTLSEAQGTLSLSDFQISLLKALANDVTVCGEIEPSAYVTSVTGTAINIAAGVSALTGGGFEVRRRDWAFTPGPGPDLVLRSPVPNFSIPRAAATEQYYIRMYDAGTPPNYSRFSAAVFVNLPLTT